MLLFIHPSINGHLGGFHLLAIVNSAAMNMVYKYPFESLLSITNYFGYVCRSLMLICYITMARYYSLTYRLSSDFTDFSAKIQSFSKHPRRLWFTGPRF